MISGMLHEAARVLKPGGIYICISLHKGGVVLDRFESQDPAHRIWEHPIEVVHDTVGESMVTQKVDSSDDSRDKMGLASLVTLPNTPTS